MWGVPDSHSLSLWYSTLIRCLTQREADMGRGDGGTNRTPKGLRVEKAWDCEAWTRQGVPGEDLVRGVPDSHPKGLGWRRVGAARHRAVRRYEFKRRETGGPGR